MNQPDLLPRRITPERLWLPLFILGSLIAPFALSAQTATHDAPGHSSPSGAHGAPGKSIESILPTPNEPDKRLHPDGGSWKLISADDGDAALPRVLLIGDSILRGYRPAVIEAFAGTAYVDAWVNPHHQATPGLSRMIAEILARKSYDVIHCNMGLHGWQKGRIPEGQFDALTRDLVAAIRKGAPKARLIWASSTPVTVKGRPGALDPAINPIIVDHNRRAAAVMVEAGIPINDLYAVLVPHLELARGDQFHWQPPAYVLMAQSVSRSIRVELAR